MNVCMNEWMSEWMPERMPEWINEWKNEWDAREVIETIFVKESIPLTFLNQWRMIMINELKCVVPRRDYW